MKMRASGCKLRRENTSTRPGHCRGLASIPFTKPQPVCSFISSEIVGVSSFKYCKDEVSEILIEHGLSSATGRRSGVEPKA